MSTTVEHRIDALARRDRVLAITFTVLMWIVLGFVFVVSNAVAPSAGISTALLVSVIALGSFNTASMIALMRRYAANKDLVYRPDIENLDRLRAERARGGR